MTDTHFKALFDLHYQPLCNFANRIIHDMDKSEDIVQDCFAKLWHMGNAVDETKSIKSLIYTMTKNRCLELLRKDQINRKAITHLQIVTFTEEEIIDEQEVNKWLLIDQIYVSMRHLPPKCEEVFRLSKINGLTYAQISEKLDISIKTVEAHMSKALKLLREMLAKQIEKF